MQYSEMKTAISDLVNRRDMTTAQIDRYVKMTLDRINRQLRASFMEVEVPLTVGTESDVTLPDDYLGTVSLYDDAGSSVNDPYVYKNFFDWKTVDNDSGRRIYTRRANKLYLKPGLAENDVVYLTYHAKVAYPTGDTYEPELFKLAADLVVYGASAFGASSFQDDRAADFNTAFNDLLVEVADHYRSSYMSEGPLAVEPATSQEY